MKIIYVTETKHNYLADHIISIDIELHSSFDYIDITASEFHGLRKVTPKKPEWQLEDYDIKIIDSCIYDVINGLESRGFEIVKEYQSSSSYSYYIEFYPHGKRSDDIDNLFLVKIRVSNHTNENYSDEHFEYMEKSSTFIRSIIVNDISHKYNVTKEDLPKLVGTICKLLSENRYEELTNDPDIYNKIYHIDGDNENAD